MKIKFLHLCLLLLCSINLNAQIKIEDGPIMEKNDAGKISKILGGDQNSFYTLIENGKGKGQRYFVEQYDVKDFKKGFSTQLPIAENAQNLESYYAGGHTLFFYCTDEGKKVTSTLYYCTVDAKGVASEGIELAKANNRKPERDLWVFCSFYYTISISPNKNHVAVVSRSYENKGKDLHLTLTVYNTATMAKEWDKDISEMGGKNFSIDDFGNVFYVSYASETDERNLIIVTKDGGLTALPISIGAGREMDGVNIIASGNTITVGGFYKESEAKKAGVFSQQFDLATKKSISSDALYLSDDLVKSLFGSEVKKKGVAGMIEITFGDKYIEIDNGRVINGSFYFIGKDVEKDFITKERTTYSTHQNFTVTPTSSGASYGNTTTHSTKTSTSHSATYNSDKVIVFKVNADGKAEWANSIDASSSTPVSPMSFWVSSNTSLRPEIIDFTLDDKLMIVHGNVKFVGMALRSSNVSFTSFDSKGNLASEKLCADDRNCFLYNAMGIYGYFNVYYQYGKNMIVFFNQKEMQHFSRISFR